MVMSDPAGPWHEIERHVVPFPVLPERQARLLEEFFRIRPIRHQRDNVRKHPLLVQHHPLGKLLVLFSIHRV